MLTKMLSSSAMKDHLRQVFHHAVKAVRPQELILRSLNRRDNVLTVKDKQYFMDNNVYLVGFGKAVLSMAAATVPLLEGHIQRGVLSVPIGSDSSLINELHKKNVSVIEGARDNLPDELSLKAAEGIKQLVSSLQPNDILIVLISGGGSALLPLPKVGLTLQDKQDAIRVVSHAGASIGELNLVRTALSALKGGNLANLAGGASVISLILSDIIGDPLHLIASGPTVQPPPALPSALDIVCKYELHSKLSPNIIKCLEADQTPRIPQTLENVQNILIGNNSSALEAAAAKSRQLGHSAIIISDSVSGDVSKVSQFYSNLAHTFDFTKSSLDAAIAEAQFPVFPSSTMEKSVRSVVFVAGGEPTVVVKGTGKGGRNQELALRVGCTLPPDTCFLSAGTDGLDGPTDVAGAVCVAEADQNDLELFLDNNDSYSYLKKVGGEDFIITGHTGTNVMDVHLLLVQQK